MANTSRKSSLRSHASHRYSTSSSLTSTPSFDSNSKTSVTESQNTTDGNVTGIEETATLPTCSSGLSTASSTYRSSESISNNSTFKVLQKYQKYFWIRDLEDAGTRYNDSKAKCRDCREIVTIRRGNTTGLRIHMKNEHGITVTPEIKEHIFEDALAAWVISKRLPYNFFEDDDTQLFFHTINPNHRYPKRADLKKMVANFRAHPLF